ncbi:MAG: hypothetical protein ROO76_04015 [Terriglobia bacterium]|nr:hypothetical protein [Terriglobia bacterium]
MVDGTSHVTPYPEYPLPAVQGVTVCSRSFVTLQAISSLAQQEKRRYDLGVRILKQLTFAVAAVFLAGVLARLAAVLFLVNAPTVLTVVVFVGVFLVTFTGLLLAGMAFLVETSLTRSEKRTPDQISWNWY